MWATIVLLLVAWPLGISWIFLVERLYDGESHGRIRIDLRQRLLYLYSRGLVVSQTSWRQVILTYVLLVGWLVVAGSFIWSLTTAPEEESTGGSMGLLVLLLCGLLECCSWIATDAKHPTKIVAAALRQIMLWLVIGVALAGVAALTGSLGWQASFVMQQRTGVWTAVIQPLGMIGFVGAVAMTLRTRSELPELLAETKLCCLALVTVVVYCGGWHFWGVAAYTSADEPSFSALLLCGIVVLLKTAIVGGGFIWIRLKSCEGTLSGAWDPIENRLLPLVGVNFLLAGIGSMWLGPEDHLSRSLLSWIVIAGAMLYAVLFHRRDVAKGWKLNRG